MDVIRESDLQTLLGDPKGHCVSLYLPTRRGGGEEDVIRWKNLLGRAHEALTAAGLRRSAAAEMLKPARDLLDQPPFWKAVSDGLAFFLAPGLTRCYRLPVPFAERAVVGKRFHVKPLLPLLRGNGRFFVLALSQKHVRLLQGNRFGVQEMDLKNVPHSLAEALRFHDTDAVLTFHTRPISGGGWGAIFEGHGVGIDDHKDDLLGYFRQIDRGLHELLRQEHAPLVLAAVDYLWPIYREANTYPHLLGQGVPGNPDRLSDRELQAEAWALVRPVFEEERGKAAALYARLAGTGHTSDNLEEVVRASHAGRVEVLFVPTDQDRWGAFDPATGEVLLRATPRPGDEEMLNLATLYTLRHGGTVYGTAPGEAPGDSLLAAIYRVSRGKKEAAAPPEAARGKR